MAKPHVKIDGGEATVEGAARKQQRGILDYLAGQDRCHFRDINAA